MRTLLLTGLLLAGCTTTDAVTIRLLPDDAVLYAIAEPDGWESWSFGLALGSPNGRPAIDAIELEHRNDATVMHLIRLDHGAIASYQDPAERDEPELRIHGLQTRLPADLGVSVVRIRAFRGKVLVANRTVRLRRYAQSDRYALPVRGCWSVTAAYDAGGPPRRRLDQAAFGWDLVKVHGDGLPLVGIPADRASYRAVVQHVYAPAAGVVVAAADTEQDSQPGTAAPDAAANFVVIEHDGRVRSKLVHLQQGSLVVAVGDHVTAGQPLATAGNSGHLDTPHLHLHFQTRRPDGTDGGQVPAQLSGYRVITAQGGQTLVDRGRPRRGDVVCSR